MSTLKGEKWEEPGASSVASIVASLHSGHYLFRMLSPRTEYSPLVAVRDSLPLGEGKKGFPSGDEPPMTASGGNIIDGEISRNKQSPQCGVAPSEAADCCHARSKVEQGQSDDSRVTDEGPVRVSGPLKTDNH